MDIPKEPSVYFIKNTIPDILDSLIETTNKFLEEHPKGYIKDLPFFVDRYKADIEVMPNDADIPQIRSLIDRIKTGIASEISIIIRYAEGDGAVHYKHKETLCDPDETP